MSSAVTSPRKSDWTAGPVEPWLQSAIGWIVVISLLLAFGLRLNSALGTYLNPDEALHHQLVNQNNVAAAYQASLTNAHPPLFFILLYYWRYIGNSEVGLRLPSILASTAAAGMGYLWIATLLGNAAGLAMLLLLSFSPMLTALGAEVRDYSVLLMCMLSALYFLERAFQDQRVSSIVYSAVFLYLAILTHYSALWFVIAAGVYVLLRIYALHRGPRIAWMLSQVGGVAIYVWLYVTHISKMRGSPMEAEAMTGWLRGLYFQAGDSRVLFAQRSTVGLFQFLFSSEYWGDVALAFFAAGVLWLLCGLFQKRRDLSAFAILLLSPFAFGIAASLLDLYPYGGTRHSSYLTPFAYAGVSFLIAKIAQQRLLPIVLVAVLCVPFWYLYHLKDPQQMDRKQQVKEMMDSAIADLRASVPPDEPVFSDYQASVMLAYYLGRDHPPPPARQCGGVTEIQYGANHVVVVGGWSATAAELTAGLEGWRKGCGPAPRESVWIYDAGWGENLLDSVNKSAPQAVSRGQRYGETISLFKLRMDH